MPSPLLVVVGPTASGKTELAIALARRLDGEIISADSIQVYRHFEIGTGKPNAAERRAAPHHLIDVAEPTEAMDAARFAELALACIEQIRARGRTPIVCGGTFLWVRALVHGLAAAPPSSSELRARHAEIAERSGRAALHAELSRVDPVCAARLAPNDFVRVSRALEVFELSGVPMSRWQAEHGFREQRFAPRLFGVRRSKEELDVRIRARAEYMLGAGWLEEVSALEAKGFGETRAMASVGYKQVRDATLAAERPEPAVLLDAVTRATRIFARRQRTWLRDEPVSYVAADCSDVDHAALASSLTAETQ